MASVSSANSTSELSFDDLGTDDEWEMELEIALLQNAEVSKIRSICQLRPVPDRLRRDLWRLCLNLESNSADMSNFTEVFDLPAQEQLHNTCECSANTLLSELSASNSTPVDPNIELPTFSQLTSDFESVLTHFSQSYNLPFAPENGWIAILETLYRVLRPLDRTDLYVYFTSVFHRFVASGPQGSLRASSVFRLLLQYHEPELCNFLDSHKLGPEVYAKSWMESLFAGHLSTDTVFAMWDIYFLSEPQFGMFVALILLVNAKSRLMELNTATSEEEKVDGAFSFGDDESDNDGGLQTKPKKSREELLFELKQLPAPMQPSDLVSLVELAQIYQRNTPDSLRRVYLPLLFGGDGDREAGDHLISHGLSLMVSVEEILSAQEELMNADGKEERVRFLLVDCRPADQYNAGHLATAFYLDTEVMLSNPPEFNTIAQALLQSQQRSIASGSKAAGEHIAFMGSGRQAEDRVVNMVIAHFLRLNTLYVSLVDGGYAALHEALGPLMFDQRIVNHETDLCFVCYNKGQNMSKLACENPTSTGSVATISTTRQPRTGVFSKLSNLLKKTSPKQTVRPSITSSTPVTAGMHKPPASYRNTAAVFSIDDNDDDDDDEPADLSSFKPNAYMSTGQKHGFTSLDHCSPGDLVDFTAVRYVLEVQSHFECHLFDEIGHIAEEGVILLLERHFIVVKEKKQQLSDTISHLGIRMQQAFSNRQQTKTSSEHRQDGIVCASIPLSTMIRITSNKRIPEVITFHYSRLDDLVSESLQAIRLFIPKSGDAVKAVKLAVFKVNAIDTGTSA